MAYQNIAETVPRVPYQQRDRRYITEYVLLAFPGRPAWFNLRLGHAPDEIARRNPGINVDRVARVWLRTADAVVANEVEFVLLEGELRRPVESVGELLIYRDLIYDTAELRPYGRLPIRMMLVCPINDPSLSSIMRGQGIELAIYQPQWALDYLRSVNQ